MNKIKKITSNIKSPNGESWTREIGDRTILIGPNESGKSAITEAIQLATSGSAYGLFLRSAQVKSGSQLGNLATTEDEIFAEVEYSDGSTSRWEMVKGGRPKRTGEKVTVTPVAQLRDALSGSAMKARHFFAGYLLDTPITRVKFEKLLPNKGIDLTVPLEKILPDYGKDLNAADIIKASKSCGSWKRECQSDGRAASALIKVFMGDDEPMDQEAETQALDNMQTALKFEWLRKQYQNNEARELQDALGKLALTLGDKQSLKELKGSAQYWDELKAMWKSENKYRGLHTARRRVKTAEVESDEFAALEHALDIALMMLLAPELTKYCRQVNKFLPKGDQFGIRHDPKGFKIFLKRGGEEHHALSGSTEARVLAAMGAALAVMSNQSSMVILDDRMWDAKTLARTMERLEHPQIEDAPVQFILMSTFKPRGRARAKWKYVEIQSKGYAQEDEDSQEETEVQAEGSPFQEAGK